MKKIRNILFALPLALTLIACSDDDIATTPATTNPLDELGAVTGTIASSAEFNGGVGDADLLLSKSRLYYDRLYNKLKFTWVEGDKIGIFAESNDKNQFPFVLVGDEGDLVATSTSVSGIFEPVDKEGAYPILITTKYYSYFPFREKDGETGDFTFNAIPVTYKNQTQTANEKMNYYYLNTEESRALFLESEKAAAAHLSTYDYMVSDAVSTEAAHVHFHYDHMGSIVRFFIQCPAPANPGLFVDSIQVVNNTANFTTDAVMNLNAKTLEPRTTSRVISLKFAPSIDMTNGTDNTKETYNYWYAGTYGFVMAYMMMPPIDLTRDGVDNSILYLLARQPKYYANATEYNNYYGTTKTEEEFAALKQAEKMKVYKDVDAYNEVLDPDITAKAFAALPVDKKLIDPVSKYYKATMSKLNFEAGKHYQWVPAINPDQPITFEEITIQEWKEGVNYTNNGGGTGDW